jgi:serine/threonine-protein kinase
MSQQPHSQTHTDQSFGQTAVALGYVTDAQVAECIRIQAAVRQMGLDEHLGDILTKKGYLTPQHHSNVLKKLGVHTSPIPGYTIQGKIGQGGMGIVYKATQTSVNRVVAIKILSGNATKDKTYVARFLQEAQSAANLNHKNLIAAIDVGVSNGIYYFIMEYVTGKSCRDTMTANGGPVPEATALHVMMQMAEVLDHIHQHKMVHRDIKPENILLTPEGTVKLCDLGLAKSTTSMEQSLTQEGLAVGTPYFMSPEQIRGDKDVDIRADLYSLGATMFYMLTEKHPYEGKSAAETMSMHLKEAVPDPRRLNPHIREDLGWCIQKLMAKDRSHRYQTPGELLEDLKKIQSGTAAALARQHAQRVALHAKAHNTRQFVHKKQAPPWPMIAGGAVLAAGIIVAVILLAIPHKPTETIKEKERLVYIEKPAAKPSEAPKDDASRVLAASALLASAELQMKQEKWKEALADLTKLNKDHGPLVWTQQRAAEIGKLISTCEVNQRTQETARSKAVDEARQARREGKWPEAHAAFQQLVKSGQSEYQSDLDHCRRELEAAASLKEIETARDAGRWFEVTTKINLLEQNNQQYRLDTVDKHLNELALSRLRAAFEMETGRMLGEAHVAAQANNWKRVQTLLVEIEKHRDTDTYKSKEAELKDLRTRYAQANEAAADDEASKAWNLAIKAYNDAAQDKKFDDAADAMDEYRQKHGASRVGKSKEAEINARMADAYKKRQIEKNEDAKKVYAQAKKEAAALNFELAGELVNRLVGELADTDHVKTNLSSIKSLKKACDDRARQPSHILVEMDFEDFPGGWSLYNSATGNNAFEEPREGRRSARLTIPAPNGRANHPLMGMAPRAETLSFWARTRGKSSGTQLNVLLHDDGSATTQTFSHDVQLTPEWKQHVLRFVDFKPYNSAAKGNSVLPGRIRSFSLECIGAAGTILEFQLDSLRVEAPRPPK